MIKSIEKAFRLLEILSRSDKPMRLRDIASEAGLTQSNAFRTLQTLRSLGYTRQTDDGSKHELTLKVFEIGARRVGADNLTSVAHPLLKKLAKSVEHNIILSIPDGLDGVAIDRIESRAFVRAFAHLGARAPLHSYSGGKVLLAYSPDHVIDEMCKNLTRVSAATITDPAVLREDLKRTRARGYALAVRESNDINSAMAVPIRQRHSQSVAALSISGPFEDFTEERIQVYAALLKETAAEIEQVWIDGNYWHHDWAKVPRPSSA